MPRCSFEFHFNILYYAHVLSPPPLPVDILLATIPSPFLQKAMYEKEQVLWHIFKHAIHTAVSINCAHSKYGAFEYNFSLWNCWFICYDWSLVHRYCLQLCLHLPSPLQAIHKIVLSFTERNVGWYFQFASRARMCKLCRRLFECKFTITKKCQ